MALSISKDKNAITSLDDWELLAGPKRPAQWADGRSAKEAARAWLEGGGNILPAEVQAALAAHRAFGPVLSWWAEPEARLPFGASAGEPRNTDLAIYAHGAQGPFLIAVEAKVDELFGETFIETMAAAVERYVANPRSNGVTRGLQLASALLGPRAVGDQDVKDIRKGKRLLRQQIRDLLATLAPPEGSPCQATGRRVG
ncbi:MAG TPA: hypothetical protein PKM43_24145 [Verrucomicrobiota bacterium]|nr:hypothetical protein [Verrucomicrobiota bacterium]